MRICVAVSVIEILSTFLSLAFARETTACLCRNWRTHECLSKTDCTVRGHSVVSRQLRPSCACELRFRRAQMRPRPSGISLTGFLVRAQPADSREPKDRGSPLGQIQFPGP